MSKELSPFGKKDALPAFLAKEHDTSGNENVSAEDLAVPQLKVLQPQSPEALNNKGMQPGQMMLTVKNETYDELYAINLSFDSHFVVWRDRKQGGGKMGQANTQQEAMEIVAGLPGTAADYNISRSHVHKLLLLNKDGSVLSPAQLFLSSTGLQFSQRWNTEIMLAYDGKPRFSGVWQLTTKTESNAKGTWYALDVQFAGYVTEELFNEAKDTHKALALEEPAEWTPPQDTPTTA